MAHPVLKPFIPIEKAEQAKALSRYSVLAFILWGSVLAVQAALVLSGIGTEDAAYRGSTAGLAVMQAILAAFAAFMHWRKPSPVFPGFGLAWSLFELSSLLVGLFVGMPMAIGGLPAWVGALSAGIVLLCAVLHVAGLRASAALRRF